MHLSLTSVLWACSAIAVPLADPDALHLAHEGSVIQNSVEYSKAIRTNGLEPVQQPPAKSTKPSGKGNSITLLFARGTLESGKQEDLRSYFLSKPTMYSTQALLVFAPLIPIERY
jgi:hypothetical protein